MSDDLSKSASQRLLVAAVIPALLALVVMSSRSSDLAGVSAPAAGDRGVVTRAVAAFESAAERDADPREQAIALSDRCPPSFEKTGAGVCELRNMYQFYDSLQDQGVGGTQTALPAHRDGFRPQQIDLGRYLFFDPALSGDGSTSCASCHHPELGFSDGRARAVGIAGHAVGRSSPTLWNVAFLKHLFWDARADSLEEQAQGPLYSPEEMANNPAQLLATLQGSEAYRRLFKEAFPEAKVEEINLQQVYRALAAFQTSLISLNSRYDRYAHGYHAALSEREIEGMNVFRSFVARCAECHTPPLFTNQQVAVIGSPEPEGLPLDVGAEAIWKAPKMKGGFKVPTLRNIAKTAPYMHSGRFETLREAVAFYTGGRGHAVPPGVDMHIHWHIWEPNLSDEELDRLVDFLGALTDETFTPAIPQRVPSGLPPIGISPLNNTNNSSQHSPSIADSSRDRVEQPLGASS
ncbi:cytochrome-c peroxidase [Congregibacter litoralis]|uniref:Cytochrome c peroxidase n=1 Tax=Congregibacter litoralis KT71 TaxID=314285 RepID=A4A9T9_9GAMM|nr:cytochrome c peroxidase [Congregibacter litoralis]EAQ97256.1 Cytochrome c peroxidase [Congregibacter litoralis KT71]